MTQWTMPQQQAIEDRGGTLLVSASAGSGKTAVLVERALRLLTGPEPIGADKLLILTFSNAAAAELRSRLGLKLEELLRAKPGDVALRRQQMLLQRASISTVSAFCMQLLREHFSGLDIPPDFAVADEAVVFELREAVLAQVLAESYENPQFTEFASVFGRSRTDRQAGEALLAVYDHLRALPFFEQALGEITALYETPVPPWQSAYGRELMQGAAEQLQVGCNLCDAALRLVAQEPALAGYEPMLQADRACLVQAGALLEQGRWDDARGVLLGYEAPRLAAIRGFDGTEKQIVQQLRSDIKKQIGNVLSDQLLCSEAEFCEDLAAAKPLIGALADALRLFDTKFFAAKCEEKILEFSDFEHLALRLLATPDGQKTPLAKEVSAGFDVVMVDEYQDTNAIQDLLYRLLANDEGSNLFFVGDVKQSIYRFRKAMPEIFIDKKQRYAPYDGCHYPAALTLGHNFRSSRAVIDGINYLFSCLMCKEVGELDYTGGELLLPGSDAQDTGLPGVELRVLDAAQNPAFGEADAVAAQIAEMVHTGAPVRGKDGTLRACNYGDFCILLRSPRGSAQLFADALAARGIPVHTDLGEGILTLPEVLVLTAALRVLDNPAQDVPLAAVLTSVMFGFTSGELAAMRAETPKGSLYGAVQASALPKAQQFCRWLLAARTEAAFLPADAVCEKVLDDTGYLLAVQAAAGDADAGQARKNALLQFVAMARGYAAAGSGGLPGFLRSVDNALSARARPAGGGVKPPAGYVCILSIHRSKGLEFPVCIVADLARQFNKKDLYTAPVLRHTRLGIGLCLRAESGARYPTAPQRAIRQALMREQLSEEMRVLYVALTRAKDRLLLYTAAKDPAAMLSKLAVSLLGAGGLTPQLVAGANSFSAWVCLAALLHPGAEELRKAAGAAQLPCRDVPPQTLSAQIITAPLHETAAPAPAEAVRTAQPQPELLAALRTSFAWQYPRSGLLAVPAKVSVSALVRQEKGEEETPLRRPSFMYNFGLSAAERGTALHAVLQYADFAAAKKDVGAEIERLQQQGFITPQTAQAADLAALRTFFASPLMQRMLAADRLLREYAFFTRVPAGSIAPLEGQNAQEPVLVQGVADCVIEKDGELFLVDYKTDHGKSRDELRKAYAPQLALYRAALEKRLGLPVARCSLYSFSYGEELVL